MTVTETQLRQFAYLPPVEVIPDAWLTVFCQAAALVRTENLAGVTPSLSSGRLDLIELNLAAHYAVITYERGGLTAEVVGTSEERYHLINNKVYGLASTRFGQTALSLDSSGVLVALAAYPLKALFRVVGDNPAYVPYPNQMDGL